MAYGPFSGEPVITPDRVASPIWPVLVGALRPDSSHFGPTSEWPEIARKRPYSDSVGFAGLKLTCSQVRPTHVIESRRSWRAPPGTSRRGGANEPDAPLRPCLVALGTASLFSQRTAIVTVLDVTAPAESVTDTLLPVWLFAGTCPSTW